MCMCCVLAARTVRGCGVTIYHYMYMYIINSLGPIADTFVRYLHKLMGIYIGDLTLARRYTLLRTWFLLLLAVFYGP